MELERLKELIHAMRDKAFADFDREEDSEEKDFIDGRIDAFSEVLRILGDENYYDICRWKFCGDSDKIKVYLGDKPLD